MHPHSKACSVYNLIKYLKIYEVIDVSETWRCQPDIHKTGKVLKPWLSGSRSEGHKTCRFVKNGYMKTSPRPIYLSIRIKVITKYNAAND